MINNVIKGISIFVCLIVLGGCNYTLMEHTDEAHNTQTPIIEPTASTDVPSDGSDEAHNTQTPIIEPTASTDVPSDGSDEDTITITCDEDWHNLLIADTVSKVVLSEDVTFIPESTFKKNALREFAVHADNEVFTADKGVLLNKEMTELVAFPGRYSTHYILPDSVIRVSPGAFAYHSDLLTVALHNDRLQTIGEEAFYCSKIVGVFFSEGLQEIGDRAFYGTRIKRLLLPESVRYIGEEAFVAYDLRLVLFMGTPPELAETEDSTPFYRWGHENETVFTTDYAPPTIYYLNKNKAYWAPNGEMEWHGCPLVGIEDPDSFYALDDGVPADDSAEDVLTITCDADWENLYVANTVGTVVLSEGVTYVPGLIFEGKKSIRQVILPESLKVIESYAFYHCSGIRELELPQGLTWIGEDAFWGTSLETIEFPPLVRYPMTDEPPLPDTIRTIILHDSKSFLSCLLRSTPNVEQLVFLSDIKEPLDLFWAHEDDVALTIYYLREHADSWAPNGETEYDGFPLVCIDSLDDLPPLD